GWNFGLPVVISPSSSVPLSSGSSVSTSQPPTYRERCIADTSTLYSSSGGVVSTPPEAPVDASICAIELWPARQSAAGEQHGNGKQRETHLDSSSDQRDQDRSCGQQ